MSTVKKIVLNASSWLFYRLEVVSVNFDTFPNLQFIIYSNQSAHLIIS